MPRSKEAFEAMKETTRIKIEKAALPLFAKKGFSVSISEIAAAAGVSKGLLYNNFSSKEALVIELARQAITASERSMKAIADNNDNAVDKINRVTTMICDMFTANHADIDYFMFMAQAGMSGFRVKELVYDVYDLTNPNETFTQIISAGQSEGTVISGDPEQLAMTYWATVQGLCCYILMGMKLSPKPEMLLRILLK